MASAPNTTLPCKTRVRQNNQSCCPRCQQAQFWVGTLGRIQPKFKTSFQTQMCQILLQISQGVPHPPIQTVPTTWCYPQPTSKLLEAADVKPRDSLYRLPPPQLPLLRQVQTSDQPAFAPGENSRLPPLLHLQHPATTCRCFALISHVTHASGWPSQPVKRAT